MDGFFLKWISDKFGDWLQEERGVVLPSLNIFLIRAEVILTTCWGFAIVAEGIQDPDGPSYLLMTLGGLFLALNLLFWPRERARIKSLESLEKSWDDMKTHDRARSKALFNRENFSGIRAFNLAFFSYFVMIDLLTIVVIGFGRPGFSGVDALALSFFASTFFKGYVECMFPKTPNTTVRELKLAESHF